MNKFYVLEADVGAFFKASKTLSKPNPNPKVNAKFKIT